METTVQPQPIHNGHILSRSVGWEKFGSTCKLRHGQVFDNAVP